LIYKKKNPDVAIKLADVNGIFKSEENLILKWR
jgi:hypothetical protein